MAFKEIILPRLTSKYFICIGKWELCLGSAVAAIFKSIGSAGEKQIK